METRSLGQAIPYSPYAVFARPAKPAADVRPGAGSTAATGLPRTFALPIPPTATTRGTTT